MASKGTLQSLARIGYVRSIADQYQEQCPGMPDNVRGMMDGLRSECDAAMKLWPESLTYRDMQHIADMLESMSSRTPMDKPRSIITYLAFGLALLEDMRPYLYPDKKKAVIRCLEQLKVIYRHFSEGHENYNSLRCAADGADAWTKTFQEG